jgi:hypothetical protein
MRPTGWSSSSIWTPSCRAMASPCGTSLPKRLATRPQRKSMIRTHGDGWRFPRSPVDSDGVPNPRATDHPYETITKPIRLANPAAADLPHCSVLCTNKPPGRPGPQVVCGVGTRGQVIRVRAVLAVRRWLHIGWRRRPPSAVCRIGSTKSESPWIWAMAMIISSTCSSVRSSRTSCDRCAAASSGRPAARTRARF